MLQGAGALSLSLPAMHAPSARQQDVLVVAWRLHRAGGWRRGTDSHGEK